ncbi:MAG: hypothetical protein RIT45_2992 [Pseudomonadota bacterium]
MATATWTLPPSATLVELASNPAASLPLDGTGRPLLDPVTVEPLRGASEAGDTWPERIDPAAVAMTSALAAFREHRDADALGVANRLRCPASYRTGLLSALAGREIGPNMRRFRREGLLDASHDWHADAAKPADEDHPIAGLLVHCIEDVARNVFHHAGAGAIGAHVAWRHEATDSGSRWHVAVADTGKGIIQDIRKAQRGHVTPEDALDLAFSPQYSGSAQPGINQGVGLYVVRSVTLRLGGGIRVWTDDYLFEALSRTVEASRGATRKITNRWPGTVVEFTIRMPPDGAATRHLVHDVLSDLEQHDAGDRLPIQFFDAGGSSSRDASESDVVVLLGEAGRVIETDRLAAAATATRILEDVSRLQTRAIVLDARHVKVMTDAYAYALLFPLASWLTEGGVVQVVAASPQVRGALLTSVRALRRAGLLGR